MELARTTRPVSLPELEDIHSQPALKRPKAARRIRPIPRGSAWAWCAIRKTALSAGLNVSETKQEITVEAAMVAANCVKNRPEKPEMKAVGTKTAHRGRAMAGGAPG